MAILTMRRRPSHDGTCRRGGSSLGAALLLALAAAMLTPPPAIAQSRAGRNPVQIDLGALDTLPPAADTKPTIRLHPPVAAAAAPAKGAAGLRQSAAEPTVPLPDARRVPPPPDLSEPPAAKAAKTAKAAPPPPAVAPPPAPAAPAATQSPTAPPAAAATAAATPQASAPPAAPPAGTTAAGSILFSGTGTDLADTAKQELTAMAKRLTGDTRLHLQLVAYAGGEGDASQARRVSLSRALAARTFLVDQGVDVKQVDIRPLGNRSEPGLPPDRVDLLLAER